jgi:hypothetical protein
MTDRERETKKERDQKNWNPHPGIDLAPQAVSGSTNSFRLFLVNQNLKYRYSV